VLRISRIFHGNTKYSIINADFVHGADYEALAKAGTTFKGLLSEDAVVKRGEEFTCWISTLCHAKKSDGKDDWTFDANLLTHDQGGRLESRVDGAPGVVLRLRSVAWPPPSRNRPSLVLYVHTPDEPNRAVSYSWADPAAQLIGINLRWVQASCTRASRRSAASSVPRGGALRQKPRAFSGRPRPEKRTSVRGRKPMFWARSGPSCCTVMAHPRQAPGARPSRHPTRCRHRQAA
jgi:hypothetical protein